MFEWKCFFFSSCELVQHVTQRFSLAQFTVNVFCIWFRLSLVLVSFSFTLRWMFISFRLKRRYKVKLWNSQTLTKGERFISSKEVYLRLFLSANCAKLVMDFFRTLWVTFDCPWKMFTDIDFFTFQTCLRKDKIAFWANECTQEIWRRKLNRRGC